MKFSETDFRCGLIALTHTAWSNLYDLQVQAVRIATESEYSHVAPVLMLDGVPFACESVEPTIRLMPLANLLTEHGFYWLPLVGEMTPEARAFALSKVGLAKYSKLEAVAADFGLLDVGANDKWECAEWTIVLVRMLGIELGPKATPAAVVQQAQALGAPLYLITQ